MQVDNLFLFSPAVESGYIINTAPLLNKAYVIYNTNDIAIKLGKLFKFHDFGDMGNRGYDHPSDKIINVKYHLQKELTWSQQFYQILGFNHSDYFLDHNIDEWVQFISDKTNLKQK